MSHQELGPVKPKAVCCFSGGLDSTVLLRLLQVEGYDVYALSVDYGQRHHKELESASKVFNMMGLPFNNLKFINFGLDVCGLFKGSSQTSKEIPVPEGHYAEESMKATVVPNRNAVLLSLATAWAVSLKAEKVAYAAHAGDHTIYPDCRPEFVSYMGSAIDCCDWNPPNLYTPFLKSSKADIVRLGYDIDAPMHLSYSCYVGKENHCGKCGTDVERKEAFQLANVPDPTVYEE